MPKSFLITNRRYRRRRRAVRGDAGSPGVSSIGEGCDLDLKQLQDGGTAMCYKRFGGSIGSSELDLISEPSEEDSYLKDVVNDSSMFGSGAGQGCFSVFSGLPSASSASLAFDILPYDPLLSREERLSFSLFPDLLNCFNFPKKSPEIEDPNIKSTYYTLDSCNEIEDGTIWVGSPIVTVDHLDLHICPECGKQYSNASNLARHRQTHRGSTGDRKPRKCPHCDKEYVSMPAYSMHVRTHNQGCACPHCGKRFSRPWLLQGHVRTHTGEKPFHCPHCAKTFADKSNLRAHIQTHSTEKPFVCGRCGKAFALKSYLYKHEESSCMRTSRFYDGIHQQRSC